jgi:hypothetical protein
LRRHVDAGHHLDAWIASVFGKTSGMKKMLALILVSFGVLSVSACDDDDNENLREKAEDVAGSASARAAAEAMRGALEAQDLNDDKTLRDVDVLRENADDVPGDPSVEGIVDANGDGKDDDGRVELRVGDQAACVIVTTANKVSVENNACSTQ